MNFYAHFLYDIPNDNLTDIIFIADSKYNNKNRYIVRDEDNEYYYIAMKPNNIECNQVCKFSKKDEGTVFYLKEE